MRLIVCRERPHPGAQLSLFEETDGYRYQVVATNTGVGQRAFLEARKTRNAGGGHRGELAGVGKCEGADRPVTALPVAADQSAPPVLFHLSVLELSAAVMAMCRARSRITPTGCVCPLT